MSLCPKDGRPCCDDLCRGGGCIALGGYGMLEVCQFCNGTLDPEMPECSTCSCDDDEYPREDDE
jgi:hypothetical protein